MQTNNAAAQADQAAYFIYAGRTPQKQYLYYVLNDLADNDGQVVARQELETFYVDKKIFKTNRIGLVMPVILTNGGKSVKFNKQARAVAYWKTEADLIEWKLADAAAETVALIERKGRANQLIKTLEPIRQHYARSSKIERAAILAEVIRIITQ